MNPNVNPRGALHLALVPGYQFNPTSGADQGTDGVGMDGQKCKRGAFIAVLIVGAVLVPVRTASANPPIPGILQVSAGSEHTCAFLATGYVKCWGLNSNGQLGDGTLTTKQKPPTGNGLNGFKAVVAGGNHSCALALADSGVWCWGSRERGQIGTGGTGGAFPTPSRVSETGGFRTGVSALALGAEFSCGLKDGGVKCWGRNDSGQIGNNSTATAQWPLQVTGLTPGTAKQIATGGKHACAITSTDTVKCWGLSERGQVGATAPSVCGGLPCAKVPVDVPGLTNIVALALGGQHSCALSASGGVKCWGSNGAGAVGNNSGVDAHAPVDVSGLTSGVASIAAGGGETCARTTANALLCWGANSQGQVGDGTTTNRLIPTAVPGAAANIASISVGRQHACLRTTSGATKCWGENANGQLGDDSRIDLYGPFVPDPPRSVVATRGDRSATVTFTAPAYDGGFPIQEYTVTSSPPSVVQTVSPAGALTASFTGLTNGTKYIFTVKATNEVGVSRSASSQPVTPATYPGKPLSVSGKPGSASGSAAISWKAAATNGSAISSYTVVASPGGRSAAVGGTSTKATVTGLKPGSTYSFVVKARNGVGAGPESNAVSVKLPNPKTGYLMLGAAGTVYPFGDSPRLGGAVYANWSNGTRAAAITVRADGSGYWTVDTAGGVRAFGTAKYLGQHPRLRQGEVVSTLAATPTGKGYWIFTNRGRAIRYGDAKFYGDMSKVRLNGPVIASAATPTGKGYYMVASDGGVFSFGDAKFYGSTGSKRLNKPVVGLSSTPTNRGYWLVASDGGVFTFGDASFRGSMGSVRLAKPVNGLVPFGKGYLMVASDGGVFVFSNKSFLGSLGANPPAAPIIGIAAFAT